MLKHTKKDYKKDLKVKHLGKKTFESNVIKKLKSHNQNLNNIWKKIKFYQGYNKDSQ